MNNIRGITVEIGGDTGPLTSVLKGVNKTSNELQNELKEVNKQLKFDPSNTELLKQKQDLLKESTAALEQKQASLKQALTQVKDQYANGDLGADKVRAVEREYEKVNSQLKETKDNLNKSLQETGTFTEKCKAKFSDLKDKIKDTFNAENVKSAIGAVGIAVGSFLKGSIEEAGEAQQANTDLEQTLKSTKGAAGMTSESLNELSESLAANTTFANDDIKSGEAMLLTFTNIGKDVFPQATSSVLDFAQKMGTAPKEAALTLGKALNDPSEGLSKLTRAGVTFTAQQEEQIKSMQAAGDTAGAQKIMLDELTKEFGGQATAATENYTGQQKQLTNILKEVKETIGSAIIPILLNVGKTVAPILKNIAEFVSAHPKITAAILAIIAVAGTLIGGMSLLSTVMTSFSVITGASIIPLTGAGAAAGGAAVGFGALLLPITLVILAIGALGLAAYEIIKNWEPIKQFFSNLWAGTKKVFSDFWTWLKSFFSQWYPIILGILSGGILLIPLLIIKNWSSIKEFFINLWNGIKTGATAAWNGIKTVIMAIVTPLVNGIKNLWDSMKGGIDTAMNGIKSILSGAWTIIKNIVLAPVLLICDLVTGNFGKLKEDMGKIWDNIKNAASQVWNGIKEFFSGTLQAITGFFTTEWNGIKNICSTVWNGIKDFFGGLWDGIKNIAVNAWNAISKWFSDFWKNEINGWKIIINGLLDFFRNLPENFMSLIKKIGDAIVHGFDDAVNFIKNLPKEALEWGKDIIKGIVDGIKSAVHAVGDAVSGVAEDIRKFLHFSKPDEGPLKDFDTYMPDMMESITTGINANLGKVRGAAQNVAKTIKGAVPESLDTSINVKAAMGLSTGNNQVGTTTGETTASGGLKLQLNIDKFMNNTDKDIRQLTEEMMEVAEDYIKRRGGVFA